MRGLIYEGSGRMAFTEDLAVREPAEDEVMVRIVASGICHSDLSVLDGTIEWPAPAVLGHEGAGVIERVGAGVKLLQPGDHVALHTLPTVGTAPIAKPGVRQGAARPWAIARSLSGSATRRSGTSPRPRPSPNSRSSNSSRR